MTIAITGATGALGSLVVDALLRTEAPETLVAVVRDEAKAAPLAERGVQVRVADYTDPAALRTAFTGVDKVLLVSSPEVGQRFPQHKNVIEAAQAAGVAHLVYTSLTKATTSAHALAPEHKATEELLATSDLATTVLRNNWYHENYAANVDQARETGALVAAAGTGKVAGAARRDYADAAAVVLTTAGHEGKVYELTGDTAYDYDALAAALGEVAGREVRYQPATVDEVRAGLVGAGLDEGTAGFVATLDANIAEGMLAEVDPTLVQLIGRPTTPLVEALKG
ncbi:SDR family oxidoreductase [Nocardioides sp. AE5]|uniref:SDR family oxidoreductase n=1 Tax=Nocardioides sp. AE5 TaxID=2962573 RepID=UPI0028827B11|nr:SDR family oxidoreductase [Nocardioides sp. AE5]MDT0203034.1 SDR family oxidoreductase [Nocardioides sp. AE5]